MTGTDRGTTEPVDVRVAAALARQHAEREATAGAGATRIGWKLGVGQRESIAGDIAVGYLTSATCLPPGAAYAASREDRMLHADVELFVEFGRDVPAAAEADAVEAAVERYGVALEIVDLSPLPDEPDSVVEGNVFHRAVAFGSSRTDVPRDARAAATVNGQEEASAAVAANVYEKLTPAAQLLDAVGERFRAGDRVITGSIVQVPVDRGDEVVGAISGIGDVALRVSE